MVTSPVPCSEKQRLVALYDAHTKSFAAALSRLNRLLGTSSHAEYTDMRRTVEAARMASEEARIALEQHVWDHHC